MGRPSKDAEKLVASNARARHLYHILERFEAGLVLAGSEVKALRESKVNLRDAYADVRSGEAYLVDCHIGAYSHTGYTSHEPTRSRKLLLEKREIAKLDGKLTLEGLTMVPLRLYFKKGRAKVELALVKGKKLHDKRETAKRRTAEREMAAALKRRS